MRSLERGSKRALERAWERTQERALQRAFERAHQGGWAEDVGVPQEVLKRIQHVEERRFDIDEII